MKPAAGVGFRVTSKIGVPDKANCSMHRIGTFCLLIHLLQPSAIKIYAAPKLSPALDDTTTPKAELPGCEKQ